MKIRSPELSRERLRALRLPFLCVFAVLVIAALGGLFFVTTSSAAHGCRHHHHSCQGQRAGHQQGLQQLQQQQQQMVNCVLVVPANPLSAQGLATPYQLAGEARGAGDTGGGGEPQCHENNPMQAAFVQAAVLDPATGQISVYDPLVIDRGTQPAAAPVVPTLPANAIVAVWVGFNGNNLTLIGTGAGNCVNGVPGSIFGQNAFCNAAAFFQAANQAIAAGLLKPPPLGTARDGQTCPSSRDFSLVDQDQSDNTTTQYLVTGNGRLAQDEPQNRTQLAGAQTTFNGSDERVLSIALDAAIGCSPWMVPDLGDSTHAQMLTAWPLNELQAAADQAPPVALIPGFDPFTLVDGAPNLQKNNAYRLGTDQPQIASLADANTTTYCQNLLKVGLPRVALDQQFTQGAPSPFPAMADNLFTFLAMRFSNTFSDQAGFLHCTALLGVQNPVTLRMQDGIVVAATINLNPPPLGGSTCPQTSTEQGQDAMPGQCCLPTHGQVQGSGTACCLATPAEPGQTQVLCCLTGSPLVQDQSPTPTCLTPTPTETTGTATPTVSPQATPTEGIPSPTPTEGTPQPTPSVTPSVEPSATSGESN